MKIDFSIMPSLRCNLQCSFCMYDAQLYETDVLDYARAANFIDQWKWEDINAVGFYGGEPFINLPLYQNFIDLIPFYIPKFIISNGSWSTDLGLTIEFLHFLQKNELFLIVSGTKEHTPFQNREVLEILYNEHSEAMRLKSEDVIHEMGRGKPEHTCCGAFCQYDKRVMRLAIHPSGNIIYQNCHGNYPIVQTIDDPYEGIYERALAVAEKCARDKGLYVGSEIPNIKTY